MRWNMIDREKNEEIAKRYGIEVTYTEKGNGGIIPEANCNIVNKFEHFTDDELYMLKRQALGSSWKIIMTGEYNEFEKKVHNQIINEINDEIKRREYGK